MAGVIEIFPKRFIGANYTQTVDEVVDAGGANFGALQIWLDPALTGSDEVEIQVQHANVNDESSFVDVDDADWKITFTSSSTATVIAVSSHFGRYLRLKITVTLGSSTKGVNLRAVLVLKDNL